MLWYLLLFMGILWSVVIRWQRRGFHKLAKQLKCDLTLYPVVGHAYALTKIKTNEGLMSIINEYGKQANKYGGLSYMWVGPVFGLVVTDPNILQMISKKCLAKHYAMRFLSMIVGNGSFVAPVNIWRNRRKAIVPMFRQLCINQFIEVFSRQSKVLVEQLREVDGNENFSVSKYISGYNIDSFCENTLGVQERVQYSQNRTFANALEACYKLASARMFRPWLHSSAIYKLTPEYKTYKDQSKVFGGFIDQLIQAKRKEIQAKTEEKLEPNHENVPNANKKKLKPFLESILESSESSLTDEECREEILVMAIASSDTTTIALSFVCVMLSRHPEIQEKAYQELREVFGDSDRLIEAEDLSKLKYVEAVVKETLRLYPPAPGVIREVTKDIQITPELTLVKGMGVCLYFYAMHRNPKYWGEDAEMFRPERFLDGPLKHPEAYMPFSTGPRNCPGYKYAMMSLEIATATLLRNFQLLPATTTKQTTSDMNINTPIRLQMDIMMRDVEGYQVRIKSRIKIEK